MYKIDRRGVQKWLTRTDPIYCYLDKGKEGKECKECYEGLGQYMRLLWLYCCNLFCN